jgi:hypothetical protein
MRGGTVVTVACLGAMTLPARADVPTVTVACTALGCTADGGIPPVKTLHLVVRVADARGRVPHVRSDGKDRALAPCAQDRTAYCGDVTSVEAGTLWFNGIAVTVIVPRPPRSFSDVETARSLGTSLYELNTDLGAKIQALRSGDTKALGSTIETKALGGEGTRRIPRLTPDPARHDEPPPRRIATAPSTAPDETPPVIPRSDVRVRLIPEPPATAAIPRVHYTPLPLDDDSYPDLVAIGTAAGLDCSGIAISRHWVLTAGHCGTATRVVVASDVAAPAFDARVDAIASPPDPRIDLALLHTAVELPVTPHARRHAGDSEPPTTDLRVLGFGISNFSTRSGFGVKRLFEVTVEGWGCDGSRPRTTGCDPARELVIPAEAGHDTCNGDSGGAVLELDESGDAWRLAAITSRAASVLDSGCGKGGIYVRIDTAASWIDAVAKGP